MPPYNPDLHHRRSTRLQQYDYRWVGAYHITICTFQRLCTFGDVLDGRMVLNEVGRTVEEEWTKTPSLRSEVTIDAFVVMPNHLHGVLVFDDSNPDAAKGDTIQSTRFVRHKRSIGSVIAGFKSATTKRINIARNSPRQPVWQRNYHDQVIRGEPHLDHVRQYIAANPANWTKDEHNPSVWQPV